METIYFYSFTQSLCPKHFDHNRQYEKKNLFLMRGKITLNCNAKVLYLFISSSFQFFCRFSGCVCVCTIVIIYFGCAQHRYLHFGCVLYFPVNPTAFRKQNSTHWLIWIWHRVAENYALLYVTVCTIDSVCERKIIGNCQRRWGICAQLLLLDNRRMLCAALHAALFYCFCTLYTHQSRKFI